MATRYSSGCRSSRDDTYGTGTYVGTVGASLYRYHGTYGRYRTGRYMEERKFEPISNRDSSLSGPRCRRGRERTVPVTVTLRLGPSPLFSPRGGRSTPPPRDGSGAPGRCCVDRTSGRSRYCWERVRSQAAASVASPIPALHLPLANI